MPRDLPIGDGSLRVNFDPHYVLRDVYYPHVGQENQTDGHPNRFGVWVDGQFSWLDSDDWRRDLHHEDETLVTRVRCLSERLGLELVCADCVDYHRPLYVRRVEVFDLTGRERQVRLFRSRPRRSSFLRTNARDALPHRHSERVVDVDLDDPKAVPVLGELLGSISPGFPAELLAARTVRVEGNLVAEVAAEELRHWLAKDLAGQVPEGDVGPAEHADLTTALRVGVEHTMAMNLDCQRVFADHAQVREPTALRSHAGLLHWLRRQQA